MLYLIISTIVLFVIMFIICKTRLAEIDEENRKETYTMQNLYQLMWRLFHAWVKQGKSESFMIFVYDSPEITRFTDEFYAKVEIANAFYEFGDNPNGYELFVQTLKDRDIEVNNIA